ncbi:hypothetical protein QMA09_15985 [Planococcus sp. APC 3906]|uniref:hypothetical protein n=1 Tax=Planococcus sp. APC 3906 TaxID=3035194 RepID=UPI0025B3FCFE|nr:hypothetical protein [Planococcus sp. APC 3906]MDN3451699.1 hypothetical protein [Planococcus sp. APC 3906]
MLSIVLFACQPKGEEHSNKDGMPEEMPNDFNFSLQYGIQKKNEINTFEGKLTKDLIADGVATADLILTEDEMEEIYERMREIKITETKDFTPGPINGEICTQEPHEEDEWHIVINGETLTHSISGSFCEPTDDAKQFIELRNEVVNEIKSKVAYKSLPEPRGGCE